MESQSNQPEVKDVKTLDPFSLGAPFHFTTRLSPGALAAVRLVDSNGTVLKWDGSSSWTPASPTRDSGLSR